MQEMIEKIRIRVHPSMNGHGFATLTFFANRKNILCFDDSKNHSFSDAPENIHATPSPVHAL
jgi:hypothetical protein